MRNKLIDILNGILKDNFDYVPLDKTIKIADALLENDLIKDDKVYKTEIANRMCTMRRCTKCNGEFLSIAGYNNCPKCGAKIRETHYE